MIFAECVVGWEFVDCEAAICGFKDWKFGAAICGSTDCKFKAKKQQGKFDVAK